MQETGVCFYRNEDYAYFSSSEQKYINRVLELADKHPKKVIILKTPEQNLGMIYCQIPKDWISIRVPRKLDLTEEQRAERAEQSERARCLKR